MHNTAMMPSDAGGAKTRPEDEQADDEGDDGREEDGGGGEVFQFFDLGVFVGVREVGDVFDRGVQGFGHPDEADGQDDGGPFAGRDGEPPTERDNCHGGDEMDAGVDFAFEQRSNAAEGTGKAFGFAGEESAAVGHDDKL